MTIASPHSLAGSPALYTPDLPTSNSSMESPTTQLTPEEDSDNDSRLNFHGEELGESFKIEDYRPARRGSPSTTQSFQLYTPDESRAIVKKFDRRLVLFVALLYMLSFLDRSNIGNARIAGLETDLNLSSKQYAWVLTSFYIAYIAFEWMSLLWKIIPAHVYVSGIVLCWGLTASLQSCVTSFVGLICLRFLLGIGEAGFTGIPYYLSFFFQREELALRTGFFISAAPLATSFASSLAWLILRLGENGPIAPWRLLFLIEGFPSVFIAVIAWHVVPDGPGTASYLTKRQKKVARLRLRHQRAGSTTGEKRGLRWQEVLHALTDPKSYITALMFFCANMAFSSMPVFLPTIIHEMGHSSRTSQALSAPPYLLSFLIVILTAWWSDRLQSRSYFITLHALVSATGYLCLALARPLGVGIWWRYAAIYPAAIGFFSVITIIITWTINNQESESKQGAGFAMLQIIGQCGPLVGIRLYPHHDAPFFTPGMWVCFGAMIFTAALSMCLRFYLRHQNRGKDAQGDASGDEALKTLQGERNARTLNFRYML
ncbi:MAG: hypothetical protein M1818_001163 [Claussenomyces sp. TS43310]|nr:MAG: hypothetical protein M1818_001163 [Claussenomyces sp. TS43310]